MSERHGPIRLRAGGATDTGQLRSNNQDSYMLLPERQLWVVADGMGGAQGGEVASKLAVEAIRDTYLEPGAGALSQAFAEANRRIHQAAEAPELHGMGTTSVAIALIPGDVAGEPTALGEHGHPSDLDEPKPAADDDADQGDDGTGTERWAGQGRSTVVAQPAGGDTSETGGVGEHLLVVNVGDSRAYLFRDGELTQLTEDHSVVAELVREGRLTEAEAEDHPQRNIITRVLGVYPEVEIDLWPVDPVRGDRYLLCSDGLFNEVSKEQMAAALRRLADPSEAAAELVRLANEGGGRDNITVVVVDVVDDGGVAESASAALADEPAHSSDPDLAGFSTALDPGDALPPAHAGDAGHEARARRPNRSTRRTDRKAARAGRSRLTWRVLAFTVLLLAVIGGAFATVQWYGTSTYYVGFDGDEVSIYQGRPGGLLWIDAKLQDGTGIMRDEVPAQYRDALEAGHEQSSLAQARRYVSNIERDIAKRTEAEAASTTTTTTAPPASSTTVAPPPPPSAAN